MRPKYQSCGCIKCVDGVLVKDVEGLEASFFDNHSHIESYSNYDK